MSQEINKFIYLKNIQGMKNYTEELRKIKKEPKSNYVQVNIQRDNFYQSERSIQQRYIFSRK